MGVTTDEALAKSDAFPLSEKNISAQVRAAQYAVGILRCLSFPQSVPLVNLSMHLSVVLSFTSH